MSIDDVTVYTVILTKSSGGEQLGKVPEHFIVHNNICDRLRNNMAVTIHP